MAKRKRIFILGGGASLGAHQVIHPTEEHAGFNLATLLSARPARTRGLIAAGYRDAKREMARWNAFAAAARGSIAMTSKSSPRFGTRSREGLS